MNPWQKHGIRHLSASSLGLYRSQPALWCLRYLHGVKDDAGPAAWRGLAVEAAVNAVLFQDADEARAIKIAHENFEMNAQGETSDDIEKERISLADFTKQAITVMRPHGIPVAMQFKIEHWLDGIEIPVIGYVDYVWADFLVDLKTTLRMPSEPRADHAAQIALYTKATGRKGNVCYVTPKKSAAYPIVNVEQAMGDVYRAARALRAMLNQAQTKEIAIKFFAPDFDHWMWTDPLKEKALAIWR